ncbi:MAG: DUF1559 domain-containing protein [bacterium]
MCPEKGKTGFRLIDMLVVIAVIGILVGMLVPAVVIVEEDARQTHCSNKIRALALAAMNFEISRNRYPGYQEINSADRPTSWAVQLLPYLERPDLMDRWNSEMDFDYGTLMPALEIMVCDNVTTLDAGIPATTYVANAGFYPPSQTQDALEAAQKPANGVFHDRISYAGKQVSRSEIRDGLSNTLLVSENLSASRWPAIGNPLGGPDTPLSSFSGLPKKYFSHNRFGATFVWLYAGEPVDSGAADPLPVQPVMRINGELLTRPHVDADGPPSAEYAGLSAFHPDGVNAAFADGSVKLLSNALSYQAYQQLMTPHGAKSDAPVRVSP